MTALRALIALTLLVVPQQPAPALHVLVSLSGSDRVAVVDPASGRLVREVAVGKGPHEIAVSADGRHAYVASSGAQHVARVDLRELTSRVFDLAPHKQPHDVRVSADGRRAWVAVAPSTAVLEIDAADGRLLRTMTLDRDGGWFVAAAKDGRSLYVPHLEGKALSMIDVASGRGRVIAEGGAFSGADVSPNGSELWAIEHDASRIVIVATGTNIVSGYIALPRAVFSRIAFSPAGDRAFVVQDTSLLAIDVKSRRIAGSLEMPLAGKVIAISPDGARAAVSHPAAGRVTIVDLSRLQVAGGFDAGPAPDGVAWVRAAR